ncbi:HAD family hydrolase [Paenibacillus sp. Root444D2]|uniref:HAD family hydrolase n=1 Tax=Paenibacillus sp. Root444D2 TaxID=1736538 RepID=UPI0009E7F0D5|nr:HAD family hydrolase [Paenibacillus sp. Root444D2]
MLKCIIFDLDGTIGNTLPLCIAALKKSIEPLAGRTFSDQEIRDTFGPSEEGIIHALIPNQYEEVIESFLSHYQNLHTMCATPFVGIVEVLDYAKNHNVHLSLVTGKGERGTGITLSMFRIHSYFDLIETGSPRGSRKVEAIKNVLNQLGVAPVECIYVGDSPSDIIESREVGVPIVSAAWAETTNQEELLALHPDWLFADVKEFTQFIKQTIENEVS